MQTLITNTIVLVLLVGGGGGGGVDVDVLISGFIWLDIYQNY